MQTLRAVVRIRLENLISGVVAEDRLRRKVIGLAGEVLLFLFVIFLAFFVFLVLWLWGSSLELFFFFFIFKREG